MIKKCKNSGWGQTFSEIWQTKLFLGSADLQKRFIIFLCIKAGVASPSANDMFSVEEVKLNAVHITMAP